MGKRSLAQLTLPLKDAACPQTVLSIKNSFNFINLECPHDKPSTAYTEQHAILIKREPAKHLGVLVGLKQVSLVTVSYG